MNVLVTGHQGYIGAVLVRVLRAAGHAVTGLDTGYFADCLLAQAPDPPDR
jgi:nucleoside-diphosphate-sugar epimerase